MRTHASIAGPVRAFATIGVVGFGAVGCTIGEHVAEAPVDASAIASGPDGAPSDSQPGPPDASGPRGLRAIIGERPEVTGHCSALDDRAELDDRFDPPVREQVVTAGWEFETTADDYADPTYNFAPPWSGSESGRFSVRFTGRLELAAGPHCFSVDIGATGTDIISGRNGCGQLWLDGDVALAETGYGADSADAGTACTTVTAGAHDLDIVFWYFNIFETAKLVVRHCEGAACTPDRPIAVDEVVPR